MMEDDFLPSHSHVVAYLSVLQCMRCNNVNPDAGWLYWGTMLVIKLIQKVMGTPLEGIYPYPTKVKIGKHRQYNTLDPGSLQGATGRATLLEHDEVSEPHDQSF